MASVVRLYSHPVNPFSEKVACALALKRVPYERVEMTDPEEIKALNPDTQQLPVLEVDGVRMADSPRIVRWLEELYPEPSIFATDPRARAQQESLAEWSDSSFAFYWNRWRAAQAEAEIERERAADARPPGLLARIHQHVEGRRGGDGQDAEETSAAEQDIMVEVAQRMDDLVAFLGSRPYFYSDSPNVADIAVYGMLLVMREGPMPGSAELLAERPTLAAHLQRMSRLTNSGRGRPVESGSEPDEVGPTA